MPFVAMVTCKGKGESNKPKRVNIQEFASPRQEFAGCEIRCQACDEPMHIRHSVLVRAHFAHYPNRERDCAYDRKGGESDEHRAAKTAIEAHLRYIPAYHGAVFFVEAYIRSINRIIDLLVKFPDGTLEAHEAQLAATTPEEIEERTNDYHKATIGDVIWWLGGAANNERNREACQRNYGFFGTLEIKTNYGYTESADYTDKR